jgi:hypothetical protein
MAPTDINPLGMKRMAWLLLAVCCTALVRVQPVEPLACCQSSCCHNKLPGSCGMPCGQPAPTPAPMMFAAESPARISKPAPKRDSSEGRLSEQKFYLPFIEIAAPSVALDAPASLAPAAPVPLFRAHCSVLI